MPRLAISFPQRRKDAKRITSGAEPWRLCAFAGNYWLFTSSTPDASKNASCKRRTGLCKFEKINTHYKLNHLTACQKSKLTQHAKTCHQFPAKAQRREENYVRCRALATLRLCGKLLALTSSTPDASKNALCKRRTASPAR